MDEPPRKRSHNVLLTTLIGLPIAAIVVADAFPPETLRRNLYTDRAACERDYTPAQCQTGTGSGTGSGGSGYIYHGPYYSTDRTSASASDPGPGRTGQITRTETTTRGGFGAIGRGLRAVG